MNFNRRIGVRFTDEIQVRIVPNQPSQKTEIPVTLFGSPHSPLGDSHVRNF
jgi:hypothetical protein